MHKRRFDNFFSDILVICLTVVLKLAITVFFTLYFETFYRNDLIFFGHFKNVSVDGRKKPAAQQAY